MDAPYSDLIKHRVIHFNPLHPEPDQAGAAALHLQGIPGMRLVRPLNGLTLEVSYDLLQITLECIQRFLDDWGFHLDNGLLYKLQRALYTYTETTERDNLGCPRGTTNCTQRIFANQFARQNHDCRDQRPEHWRHYL